MRKLWLWLKQIWTRPTEPTDVPVYLARCGHEMKLEDNVKVFDQEVRIKTQLRDGQPDYCLDCLVKMAIRCAWCGEPILPGEPITLYSLSPIVLDKTRPDYTVKYLDGDRLCYVGCMRWNCADSGADRAGSWVAPGEVNKDTISELAVFRSHSSVD